MPYVKSAWFIAAAALTGCTATSHAGSEPSTSIITAIGTGEPPPSVDVMTVPVPAMCEQPAGTLADGSLPDPVNNGFVSIIPEFTTTGDLVGGATRETVVAIACSAGGIGWPHTIHVYAPGPVHLTQIDLGELNPDGVVALVESVEIAEHALIVRWVTDAPGDATCCPTVRMEGRFTLAVEATGAVAVLEGSLSPSVSTVTTPAATAGSAAAGTASNATVEAAVARFQPWVRAMGTGDAETFCDIGAPGYEADGMPQGQCLELFDAIRSEETSEADLASIAEATVDPALAVQVAPDRVEIPGAAVSFPTPIADWAAPNDIFVMGFDGADWYLVEYPQ